MIKDIYNVSGRWLTNEEIVFVLSGRFTDMGLKEFKIVEANRIKDSLVEIICTDCKKKSIRKSGQILLYKLKKCKDCSDKNKGRHKKIKESKETLQEKIDKKYKEKDLSFTVLDDFKYKNNKQEVKVQCTNCSTVISTRIDLLTHGRRSCTCVQLRSVLERDTKKILDEMGIKYSMESGFSDLRSVQPLRFDFVLKINEETRIIECDGIQHFYPTFGDEAFRRTQKTDKIKNDYCKSKGIKLLRIKYNKSKNLKEIVKEFVK